jgi:hypothetical protein
MTRENGESFQTLFDEKRLYKLLSVREQKNGIFIFRAELVNKKERGMSDAEREKAQNARLREYSKERLEGDLQLDGYILLGWLQGNCIDWHKKKRRLVKNPGMAAYYPISGPRRVYIWETYGEYAPHPNPVWGNRQWTHFVETANKPKRIATEKILALLAAPKQPYNGARVQKDVWTPSVPLWLLDSKKDMRPLYLVGGKPE